MSKNLIPTSKLPQEKESIFSVMSRMANEYNAINLSQGFPNFNTDEHLQELVTRAMKDGYNQYAPLAGLPELLEEIAKKTEDLHARKYDVETEITVTNGATQALFLAITAFVQKGDEVLVFKPAYDTYEPTIELNGGIPVLVELKGKDFKIDWQEVREKISPRTKMVIINTPHNPSGNVWSKSDMETLESILKDSNIILLSDEVYEHLVFDGHKHYSASSFPELSERAVVCASFGKTFHNTGWKIGYCVAPKPLMEEIKKIHQLNSFCVNNPMQKAFSEYLKIPEHYLDLSRFYQGKRDKFLSLIKGSKFKTKPSGGTYFQLLDFSGITSEPDKDFAERLVKEHKLSSIPVSAFTIENKDTGQLRFCFAKTDETLEKASEIINKIR